LRALYADSEVAKAALDHFAGRQKSSSQTSVDRLQALLRGLGTPASRAEIVEFFKALEATHCGEFVIGRKGHPSRFVWAVSLISAGQAAAGETINVEALSETEPAELEDEATSGLLDHRFRLRPELELTVSLPPNLTVAEAVRIADYVKTLPFGT
jgi:hypothetical protein